MPETKLSPFPTYQLVGTQRFENRFWNAHLRGQWQPGEPIAYRLRVCSNINEAAYRRSLPPSNTNALELIGCSHDEMVAETEDELIQQLAEKALLLEPEPLFNAFTYMVYKSAPISTEELAPYAQSFPKTHAIVLQLAQATREQDVEATKKHLLDVQTQLASLTQFQAQQRKDCPTCSKKYAPGVGERNFNYGCPACLCSVYHQHEYEYSPTGSWDDFYRIPLELNIHLQGALQQTDRLGERYHTSASVSKFVRQRLRIIAYAAFLLHWEHWLD